MIVPDLSQPISEWLPIVWYGGYLDGLPDIALARLPLGMVDPGMRYRPWIVETPQERAKLLAALAKPISMRGDWLDFDNGPDAAVSGPSRHRRSGPLMVAQYYPAEPGWPYLTVLRYPSDLPKPPDALARGIYALDVDESEADHLRRVAQLLAMVRLKSGGKVTNVSPDRGRAH